MCGIGGWIGEGAGLSDSIALFDDLVADWGTISSSEGGTAIAISPMHR